MARAAVMDRASMRLSSRGLRPVKMSAINRSMLARPAPGRYLARPLTRPPATDSTLELLARARRKGVGVAYYVSPHDWSHTVIVAALSAWAGEGGADALRARLRGPISKSWVGPSRR